MHLYNSSKAAKNSHGSSVQSGKCENSPKRSQ